MAGCLHQLRGNLTGWGWVSSRLKFFLKAEFMEGGCGQDGGYRKGSPWVLGPTGADQIMKNCNLWFKLSLSKLFKRCCLLLLILFWLLSRNSKIFAGEHGKKLSPVDFFQLKKFGTSANPEAGFLRFFKVAFDRSG